MKYDPYTLGPVDGALVHPSGDDDLRAHPGEWFEITPPAKDTVLSVHAVIATAAAPGLLGHIEGFGDGAGRVELAADIVDRFGRRRDVLSTRAAVLDSLPDFRRGNYSGTFVDPEAGRRADGDGVPGIRGLALLSGQAPPAQVEWLSAEEPLHGRAEIESIFWDADDLRGPDGAPQEAYSLDFRLGQTGATGTSWQEWNVTGVPGAYDRSQYPFQPGQARGDVIQWRLRMSYGVSATTAYDPRSLRTPIAFRFGTCIRPRGGAWTFASFAELLHRADTTSRLMPQGWHGVQDAAVLRLPLALRLDGRQGEKLRARFVSPDPKLATLKVRVAGEVSSAAEV